MALLTFVHVHMDDGYSVHMAAAIARASAYFGQGSDPIQIYGVQCTGTEPEL